MARSDDAQKTLRALSTYSAVILEAHLSRGNRIPDTEENQNLLETLEHHRLVWRISDDEDPQLKKVLAHFLSHITESDRRRWASEQVDKLWGELTDLFDQYRKAKSKVALTDQERLESEIKEVLSELIEDIRGATETFSSHINSEFSYITDLDLRIRENERVIERAGRLITLFDSFNFLELADQAGNDPFLKRLLLKYLPATLEQGRSNLSYALNQLRVLLLRLRDDQKLNRLVGGFEAHFHKEPGFMPSIDHLDLEACPGVLNSVAPLKVLAAPDIYDPMDDAELIDLAANARMIDSVVDQPEAPPAEIDSVKFDVDGEMVEETVDPVETTIDGMIQFILAGDIGEDEIVASEVLEASALDIDKPAWLATLVAELDSLSVDDQQSINIQYHDIPDPLYPDNIHIHDLTLRRVDVG